MLTLLEGEILKSGRDEQLTSAETWLRDAQRRELARLLTEIAAPLAAGTDDPHAPLAKVA